MKYFFLIIVFILLHTVTSAQTYTHQDTLRGTITPEREWWDLTYYHLDISVDIENQSIQGSNTIQYKVLKENQVMQIDLQPPMEITNIYDGKVNLEFTRDGNAYLIMLKKNQKPGQIHEIRVEYRGKPKVAPRPPWDSGLVWEKDSLGNHFIASVSWGAGSSQWWPCKDHMYDEVDSLKFSINVEEDLVAVANGKLLEIEQLKNQTKTYHWFVSNPINNYGVNFNIANYAHFSETYSGLNGPLLCSYYVLEHNLEKAKVQFKQVPMMLEAFEHWFGPYPFYEDDYKLVEVPYLGMEHQSATAYGNNYQNGVKGRNSSNSIWGEKFDYIIIHESGHEWFACNITFKDIADIWIHESFTTYSEGLYVEYHYGKKAGEDYWVGQRNAQNDRPMIGNYNINDIKYSGDNYAKGAGILHMLRQVINDDEKWLNILRGLNKDFYHQTVTTSQIENYIADKAGLKLNYFWDQYLRTTQMPVFEYRIVGSTLSYHWTNSNTDFEMPLKIWVNGKEEWIHPKTKWQKMKLESGVVELKVDRNFYVPVFYMNPD